MTISIVHLRNSFERLLQHLEQSDYVTLDLNADYYWEVSLAERHDPYVEPKSFDLRQLSHDLAGVVEIAKGSHPPSPQGLICLGNLLRYFGEQIQITQPNDSV